jgi:hypothetical protein
MIELKTLPKFSVTNRAEGDWITISLFLTHGSHHQTLIINAVTKVEHVSDFMSSDLNDSLESPALSLFLFHVFISPFWLESMKALYTTVSWNTIAKAEVGEVFGVEIDVSERDYTDSVLFTVLDWSNNFFQDMNCVELCLTHAVFLVGDVLVLK